MWNTQTLDNAVTWTAQTYADISAAHPAKTIVIGESGWATSKASWGQQVEQVIAVASEQAQKTFYEEYSACLEQEKITAFYFEAFDDKWKGGDDPAEMEKHWGLFFSDRTPKLVMQ